jgi:hypothetical protein
MRQTEALTQWAVTILENSKLLVYSEISYTVFSLRVLVLANGGGVCGAIYNVAGPDLERFAQPLTPPLQEKPHETRHSVGPRTA